MGLCKKDVTEFIAELFHYNVWVFVLLSLTKQIF